MPLLWSGEPSAPGTATHLHPTASSAAGRVPILCLGPWDGLDAHLGPLLLIKIIIRLNVLLQASSFLL